MIENETAHSVPHKRTGLTVSASPLNQVKLELGVVLILAVVLFLLAPLLSAHFIGQFTILLGYGLAAMAWIIFRVRKVMRQAETQRESTDG